MVRESNAPFPGPFPGFLGILVRRHAAAHLLDTTPAVEAFVKNAGLGFAIRYFHNGQDHDYSPDFLIRLRYPGLFHLILETKGHDELEEIQRAAAERWVAAVNATGP